MSEIVLINDAAMQRHEKHLNVYDRGFLLGYGLFETMRARHGKLVDFAEHWQRLVSGLAKILLPLPFTMAECEEQCLRCLQLNNLQEEPLSGIRLTVSYGEAPRGLAPIDNPSPTVTITAFTIQHTRKPTISLLISDYVKNQLSPLSNVKTLNYLENSLAKQQALNAGADEAVLLNTWGRVAECTTSNIFIVKDSALYTPAISEGALAGITRSTVLQQAQQQQLETVEGSITTDELLTADEVFITNSITPVQPVSMVGKQLINDGQIGPISRLLIY